MNRFSEVQNSMVSSASPPLPSIMLRYRTTASTKGLLEGFVVCSKIVINCWLRCSLQAYLRSVHNPGRGSSWKYSKESGKNSKAPLTYPGNQFSEDVGRKSFGDSRDVDGIFVVRS
jgi:hypothetical protein